MMCRARALLGDSVFEAKQPITYSTSYSGIGTPEYAFEVIQSATGIPLLPIWALERDKVCQAELINVGRRAHGGRPCVFGDIRDVIVDAGWRRRIGCVKGVKESPPVTLHGLGLQRLDVRTTCRCYAHTDAQHDLRRTHVHVAGTTCTDHSLLGKLKGDAGKNVKFYLVWIALMRKLRPLVIIHENVVGFGTGSLSADLGDLYILCQSRFCASSFGFPIRRKRQMCLLVLRSWMFHGLRSAGHSDKCTDSGVLRLIDLEGTLRHCCTRVRELSWRDFLVASDADHEEDLYYGPLYRNKLRQ